MKWSQAPDIQQEVEDIIAKLELEHIDAKRIFCYRTEGSKARAYARIWSFPKVFQEALDISPAYVIEILAEKFENLPEDKKRKVLVHELVHIPKNFSGSLLPHVKDFDKKVNALYKQLKKK